MATATRASKKEPHRLYKIDASRLMEDADYMRMKRMREAEERRHRITTKLVYELSSLNFFFF